MICVSILSTLMYHSCITHIPLKHSSTTHIHSYTLIHASTTQTLIYTHTHSYTHILPKPHIPLKHSYTTQTLIYHSNTHILASDKMWGGNQERHTAKVVEDIRDFNTTYTASFMGEQNEGMEE